MLLIAIPVKLPPTVKEVILVPAAAIESHWLDNNALALNDPVVGVGLVVKFTVANEVALPESVIFTWVNLAPLYNELESAAYEDVVYCLDDVTFEL